MLRPSGQKQPQRQSLPSVNEHDEENIRKIYVSSARILQNGRRPRLTKHGTVTGRNCRCVQTKNQARSPPESQQYARSHKIDLCSGVVLTFGDVAFHRVRRVQMQVGNVPEVACECEHVDDREE